MIMEHFVMDILVYACRTGIQWIVECMAIHASASIKCRGGRLTAVSHRLALWREADIREEKDSVGWASLVLACHPPPTHTPTVIISVLSCYIIGGFIGGATNVLSIQLFNHSRNRPNKERNNVLAHIPVPLVPAVDDSGSAEDDENGTDDDEDVVRLEHWSPHEETLANV